MSATAFQAPSPRFFQTVTAFPTLESSADLSARNCAQGRGSGTSLRSGMGGLGRKSPRMRAAKSLQMWHLVTLDGAAYNVFYRPFRKRGEGCRTFAYLKDAFPLKTAGPQLCGLGRRRKT